MSPLHLRTKPRTHSIADLLGFVAVVALIFAAAGSAARNAGPKAGLELLGITFSCHALAAALYRLTGLNLGEKDVLISSLSLMIYLLISIIFLVGLVLTFLLDTAGGVLVGLTLAASFAYHVSWSGADS